MSKILSFFMSLCLVFIINTPAFASYYEETRDLTPQEVNVLKYKMERITIRQEHGKWTVIQGINSELTDMQLLKLVNSENIATERMKNLESKQNLGSAISLGGIGLGLVGGVFVSNLIKVDNGTYYGIAGIVAGLALLVIGNSISPIVSDESDHTITIDEAKNAAQRYNFELRKRLNIKEDID